MCGFLKEAQGLGVAHPLAHDSYLINLASPDPVLWKKSVDAFVIEMLRADRLGIPYVVTHPGAHTTSSEEAGIAAIVRLDETHRQSRGIKTKCLLETTAGQGSCLGRTFEQLAAMIDGVQDPDRLGVCVDTCHIFAAGYPIATEKDYKATMQALDKTVGIKLVRAFHVNDSLKPLGSGLIDTRTSDADDRQRGVRLLMNDNRFSQSADVFGNAEGRREGKGFGYDKPAKRCDGWWRKRHNVILKGVPRLENLPSCRVLCSTVGCGKLDPSVA